MAGILDQFRKKVLSSVWKDQEQEPEDIQVDDLIALGVLLWEVAEADEKFLIEEEQKVGEVLHSYGNIAQKDMPIVLRAIQEASLEKIDLYAFTKEVSEDLKREVKIGIIENLFRIACVDGDLDEKEHGMIRKISGLFRLDHQEFIDAKIKVKKEFGLDTAGL